MFCVKCGAQLDDNAVFCPKCGNKVGEVSATASASPEVIVKSKRECIYDAVCRFLRATPQYLTGATFSDFEVYEEGQEGKIYVEIIASNRNMFGQTKATRFGAVITDVEADGNCVFATPGPQMMNAMVKPGFVKKMLGFKSL